MKRGIRLGTAFLVARNRTRTDIGDPGQDYSPDALHWYRKAVPATASWFEPCQMVAVKNS